MNAHDLITGKVKPEFGNLEHIKLLKKYEETYKDFKEGYVPDINIKYQFSVSVNCICGKGSVLFEASSDYVDDSAEHLSGLKDKCYSCKKEYKTSIQDGLLVVKYK